MVHLGAKNLSSWFICDFEVHRGLLEATEKAGSTKSSTRRKPLPGMSSNAPIGTWPASELHDELDSRCCGIILRTTMLALLVSFY